MKTEYSTPEALFISKSKIQSYAEKIAKHYNYSPINRDEDIYSFVERIGGTIHYLNEWETTTIKDNNKIFGSLTVEAIGNFNIYLPMNTSLTRDRFTIAHELGHYFLHYAVPNASGNKINKLIAYRYGVEPYEYEANCFAASFLMPSHLMKKLIKDDKYNNFQISQLLGLSEISVNFRVKDLGLE